MRGGLEGTVENVVGIERAYKRALEVLEIDRIRTEDFEDLYGAEQIQRDQAYVERMEKEFAAGETPVEKRDREVATILEAIIHEAIEQANWFGEEAHTITPTRFDDIVAGIDCLVGFREENEHDASYLGLAIDVTFSENQTTKKLKRIHDTDIEGGELKKVKYFMSEHSPVRGERRDIPRVVVGTDAKAVEDLIEVWMDPDRKRKNKALAEHPLQYMLLEQIHMQLETFEQYARSLGKDNVAAIYGRTNKIITDIIKEKPRPRTIGFEHDRVYSGIRSALAIMFKPKTESRRLRAGG